MPQLFGVDVSDHTYELNKHLIEQPKRTKTDARKVIDQVLREKLERQFDALWLRAGGDTEFWQHGYQFDTDRGWHIDRYNADTMIGVEIHGGQFARDGNSGHRNVKGMQRDWEKLNRCHELGITLWVLTTAMVTIDEVDRLKRFVDERIAKSAKF